MKPAGRNFRFVIVICILLSAISASAITFTSDTYIGPTDFSSDGQDIIVTNCTLTIDGAHGFNSLQLLDGGVLTHSAFTNGPAQIIFPVNNESQSFATTNVVTLINTNINTNTILVMDNTSTITYTPNVDYLVTLSGQFTRLTLTTNSSIAPGATVLASYDWSVIYQGLSLTISNDVDVTSGGMVNLSGMGYSGGNGFSNGVGTTQSTNFPLSVIIGGGGGHGGCGGAATTGFLFALGGASYDSTTNPANLGSGGGLAYGNGGAGGGLGRFFVGGTVQIDGQILADGLASTNGNGGGGAGGSLLISAQNFSGAGTISAQGGECGFGNTPGSGGGGGGGIIAIYSATNTYTGTIIAYGGLGANYGGAGTILTTGFTNSTGQLLIANNGSPGTNTFFLPITGNLTISGGAIAQPLASQFAVNNLFVGSNSTLHDPAFPLFLTVNGNATIESNGFISGDFLSSQPSGTATCGAGSGGNCAGRGGNSICGSSSGNPPLSFSYSAPDGIAGAGGGTPAAFGGGEITLTIAGTLSLNGQISANGQAGIATNGGGGSGGCISVTAGTISGNGLIAANGGAANNPFGGGGGGGAIAVTFGTNLFTGSVTAYGGIGANAGGAGTVYLNTNSPGSFGQLILDNDGIIGSTTALGASINQADLTIRNGAIMNGGAAIGTVRNLFIGSNSLILGITNSTTTFTSLTASNAIIQPGGGIVMDGQSANIGGQTVNSTGGGGGNGGYGGMSASNALGGSPPSLNNTGSVSIGAGGGFGANGRGGYGGGKFLFTVYDSLQLDGVISANGGTSTSTNSGGGSGGGIQLTVGSLLGAGTISANGGAGNNLGGGGSGGTITILSLTNPYSVNVTAYGGSGANFGGAGIIYQAPTATFGGSPLAQQVLIDNGGAPISTNTLLKSLINSGAFDLTIRGASVVDNISPMTNGNLIIGSNSVFLITSASQVILTVLTNAAIQPGGAIRDDGVSINPTGRGGSIISTGGGGGYGGVGGPSILGGAGGAAETDPFTAPSFAGAPGGSGGPPSGLGGNGGGFLRLIVNGTLQLDGIISAQGVTSGNTNSGGGSGGSITVNAGTISGAGTISVNGGAGNGTGGGGGGGGRIAVNYNTNSFTGNLTAYGGPGANYGGAGTVYTTSSFSGNGPITALLLDNGGFPGSPTPLSGPTTISDLKVLHGADLTFASPSNEGDISWGNLFLGSNSIYTVAWRQVTVLTNATIQPGATLFVPAVAGQTGAGPNNFHGAGGGGHGGFGGFGMTPTLVNAPGGTAFDSSTMPLSPGGAGGWAEVNGSSGGPGGGVIQMVVNGILQLDGTCSADGLAASTTNSGGGAGGAIWIEAGQFLGSGVVSANGGAGSTTNGIGGGGGGGGRIAITYNTNLFSGTVRARGGAGVQYGGAGTIYFDSSFNGGSGYFQLIVDNGGSSNAATAGLIPSGFGGPGPYVGDFILTNGSSASLGVTNASWNNLTIGSNCSLILLSNLSTLNLSVASNLTIQSGGSLNLDGAGYAANTGISRGGLVGGTGASAGGGGHGGFGSAATNTFGGSSYDSIMQPTQPGSGGGSTTSTGSAGGGALQLNVLGTLDNDGIISANGQNGVGTNQPGRAGGAGGSLWVNAGTIFGAGNFSANGGNGVTNNSGGGGGGRIAVYFGTNAFTGAISAHGGTGVTLAGGAGTIFLKTNSASAGQLFLDNGGLPGTNTPVDSLSVLSPIPLSISNGATASSGTLLTLQSLSIGSNALFTSSSQTQSTLNLTMLGDAFLDTNAAIIANGTGYNPGSGPGSGRVDFLGDGSGGGGGYGGAGGASIFGASGGATYGSSNMPVTWGSAGGVSNSPAGFSQGGGAIRLVIDGTLTLNGNISANGNNGTSQNGPGGGGSGGSIWVDVATAFAGNGSVTANGAAGYSGQGGGGGGGRIAIYTSNNLFSGTASAGGGNGANPGQPGTVIIATNLLISGNVTDTNGVGITGITLQPSGLAAVTTDSSGSYSITTPLFWTGTVAPTNAGFFVPNLRNYSNIGANFAAQNYLLTVPTAFNIGSTSFDGTNLNFTWYGINGVFYQPLYSSNLVDWLPYGPSFLGRNAPLNVALPVSTAPQLFFRLSVSY